MIDELSARREVYVRGCATMIGHGLEAQVPACVALAAAALKEKTFYRPFDESGFEKPAVTAPDRIAVTGWGHWRGESLAVIAADD